MHSTRVPFFSLSLIFSLSGRSFKRCLTFTFTQKLNELHRGFYDTHKRGAHSLIFVTDQGICAIVHLSNINFDSAANEMIYFCNKAFYLVLLLAFSFALCLSRPLLRSNTAATLKPVPSRKNWKLSVDNFPVELARVRTKNLTKLFAHFQFRKCRSFENS